MGSRPKRHRHLVEAGPVGAVEEGGHLTSVHHRSRETPGPDPSPGTTATGTESVSGNRDLVRSRKGDVSIMIKILTICKGNFNDRGRKELDIRFIRLIIFFIL